MTYQEAFNRVWDLLVADDTRQAEEVAYRHGITIDYSQADEGIIGVDDATLLFDVEA